MDHRERAGVHAALGDPARLQMVDALLAGDRTFGELAMLAGLHGNAAAHHLAVLESAGIIERRASEGDRRRRYVKLRTERLDGLIGQVKPAVHNVLFVCTNNSARSQFAAALWRTRTGLSADSAGTSPAKRVHPLAVRAARAFGLDLAGQVPKGYDGVSDAPDLVVSVCDRAHESGIPFRAPTLHWSVPDPVGPGTPDAFTSAFIDIARRIEGLAGSSPA